MNTNFALALVLLCSMLAVGGRRGLRAFIALFLNFGVIFTMVFFMVNADMNIWLVTLGGVTFASAINLFFINGVNAKTKVAFFSVLVTSFIILTFVFAMTSWSAVQGFGEEEMEAVSSFSVAVGLNFTAIAASVMMMSTIGAMLDVAISIATATFELQRYESDVTRRQLFRSGMAIGRDILGTDTNTLFFAFFGSYLALLIWFKDLSYSFREMLHAKVFVAELLTIFTAGIGIALIIPIAAWCSALAFHHRASS